MRDVPEQLSPAEVTAAPSGGITVTWDAPSGSERSTLSLSPEETTRFARQLSDWLRQKARLAYKFWNKIHIEFDGESICGYNVDVPGGRRARLPDGPLSAKVQVEFSDVRKRDSGPATVSTKIAMPLSAYARGVIPRSNLCSSCSNKAQALGLIGDPDALVKRSIDGEIVCPACTEVLTFSVVGNDVWIDHRSDSVDCQYARDSSEIGQIERLSVPDRVKICEQMIGVHDVSYAESSHESSKMRTEGDSLSPIPVDKEFELTLPDSLVAKGVYAGWCSASNFHRFQLPTPDSFDLPDKQTDGFIAIETEETAGIGALFWPTIKHIITTYAEPVDEQGLRKPIKNVAEANETHNLIGAKYDNSRGEGEEHGGQHPLTAEIFEQSLEPLDHTEYSPREYTAPEVVTELIEKYRLPERDTDLPEDVTGEEYRAMHQQGGHPSRHVHQALTDWDELRLSELFERLGISLSEGPYAHVFGGFTGEYATQLGRAGATVAFSDPIEEWVARVTGIPAIDRSFTEPLGSVPSQEFLRSDFLTTFECYPALNGGLSGGEGYDVLRALSLPHGLVFATRVETIEQMKQESRGELLQFRSRWNDSYDAVYDVTVRYREVDGLRAWQIKPTDPPTLPPNGTETVSPTVVDRLTVNALQSYRAEIDEDTSGQQSKIPVTDGRVVAHHPVCDTTSHLARSLARLWALQDGLHNGIVSPSQLVIDGQAFKLGEQYTAFIGR